MIHGWINVGQAQKVVGENEAEGHRECKRKKVAGGVGGV
jgi:hypothetical protein